MLPITRSTKTYASVLTSNSDPRSQSDQPSGHSPFAHIHVHALDLLAGHPLGCQPIALQQECRLVRAGRVDFRDALWTATLPRTGDQPHGVVQQDLERSKYHSVAAVLQPKSQRLDSQADGDRSFEEIRQHEEWRWRCLRASLVQGGRMAEPFDEEHLAALHP